MSFFQKLEASRLSGGVVVLYPLPLPPLHLPLQGGREVVLSLQQYAHLEL